MVWVYTLFIIDSINTSDIFNIKYIILVNIIQNRIIYTYNNISILPFYVNDYFINSNLIMF